MRIAHRLPVFRVVRDRDRVLPLQRITAGVEAGDDHHVLTVQNEKQRIRETPHQGTARVAEYDGKLSGTFAESPDKHVNLFAESKA